MFSFVPRPARADATQLKNPFGGEALSLQCRLFYIIAQSLCVSRLGPPSCCNSGKSKAVGVPSACRGRVFYRFGANMMVSRLMFGCNGCHGLYCRHHALLLGTPLACALRACCLYKSWLCLIYAGMHLLGFDERLHKLRGLAADIFTIRRSYKQHPLPASNRKAIPPCTYMKPTTQGCGEGPRLAALQVPASPDESLCDLVKKLRESALRLGPPKSGLEQK